MEKITLKQLTDSDIATVGEWLDKEYIRKWYGKKENWLVEIRNRNGKYHFIRHFIVFLDDRKIGFCQYFDCSFVKDLFPDIADRHHAFGIDFLIGEEDCLNKGFGTMIIRKLEEKIAEAGGKEIWADPAADNFISHKVLLNNGFIKISDEEYRKILNQTVTTQ
ncbi:MAG: acetyltransferase [Tannerella sp.]|nr:acetyltransferase [Tannerella sp.]